MSKINIDYTFKLENGLQKKVSVKDVREDIDQNQIKALADLLIEKKSQFNESPFVELTKCVKYTVDEEIIV